MRRKNAISVRVKSPTRGLVSRLPGETGSLMPAQGGLAQVSPNAATVSSNTRYEDGVVCAAPGYEKVVLNLSGSDISGNLTTLGGAVNLLFQGNVISSGNTAPVLMASDKKLWAVTPSYDSSSQTFVAGLTNLYTTATTPTAGYGWTAENFYDKIIAAQRDNNVQYWLTSTSSSADVPGLPTGDSKWDGVTVFFGHVLLWKDDRIKWSDVDDWTAWIPVANTAISAVLTTTVDFVQPALGGSVTISAAQSVAKVKALSLTGNLGFADTLSGSTSAATLNLVNTGTDTVTVSKITLPASGTTQIYSLTGLPAGWTAATTGSVTTYSPGTTLTIAAGATTALTVTFTVPGSLGADTQYNGAVTVTSDSTVGGNTHSISGKGLKLLPVSVLSGSLDFGVLFSGRTSGANPVGSLIIKNTGNAPLHVTNITSSDATFALGATTATVAAGAFAIIGVTFNPTSNTAFTTTFTVTSDTGGTAGTTQTYSGSGSQSGSNPTGSVYLTDNGTCIFNSVQVGATVSGTITIYNLSNTNLTLNSITLPTGWSASLSPGTVISQCSASTSASKLTVPVIFTPTDVGLSAGAATPVFSVSTTPNTATVYGNAVSSYSLQLSGNLIFGAVPVGGSISTTLTIKNTGLAAATVTSVSLPNGFSCDFTGTIAAGASASATVTFSPTDAVDYSGDLTVNTSSVTTGITQPVAGTGFAVPTPAVLEVGQYISIPYSGKYNYYQVTAATASTLTVTLQSLTGTSTPGSTIPSGTTVYTVDANEAGEAQVVGAQINGSIKKIIPMNDYAFIFKERSIQSIQYVGQGSGTFFVRNEVFGEGVIGINAVINRNDGWLVFLGHKELYVYQGGPAPTPVCMQATRQLYAELDRSRLSSIKLLHNELRHEIWVKYPVIGGFRVLIWNYVEDSAALDDYNSTVEFTSLSLVNWATTITWQGLSDSQSWSDFSSSGTTWTGLITSVYDRVPVLFSSDGYLRIFGRLYTRDGLGYTSIHETVDYDFGDADLYKYLDQVVLGLDIKEVVPGTTLSIQVGTRAAYSTSADEIVWSAPQQVNVDGTAPVPLNVNPGGSGRYIRVRLTSSDSGVRWRVSSFEIHCRRGNTF